MNNFLYDLTFDESDTTKDRLIKATQYLLAAYGYEATTTRMIANSAATNLSAISFHFDNKENLVRAAMEAASEKLSRHYKVLSDEIRKFLEEPKIDKEKAWDYIDRYLAQRIKRTFNGRASQINIGLVAHENGFPESCQGIMAKVAVKDNEKVLADLIYYVSEKKDRFQAVMIARAIMAAILSYMEKPLLNKELERETGVDLEDYLAVEDYMQDYFMKSIRAAVTVNPLDKLV